MLRFVVVVNFDEMLLMILIGIVVVCSVVSFLLVCLNSSVLLFFMCIMCVLCSVWWCISFLMNVCGVEW